MLSVLAFVYLLRYLYISSQSRESTIVQCTYLGATSFFDPFVLGPRIIVEQKKKKMEVTFLGSIINSFHLKYIKDDCLK